MPLVALLGFLSTLVMGYIGGRIAWNPAYIEAKMILAEYRALKDSAPLDKRAAKKLKKMEPEVRRARRVIFTVSLQKIMAYFAIYALTTLFVLVKYAVYLSPFDIPLITTRIEVEGETVTVIPASMVLLASYILFLPILQRMSEPRIVSEHPRT